MYPEGGSGKTDYTVHVRVVDKTSTEDVKLIYEDLGSQEEAPVNLQVFQSTHRTNSSSPTINVTWLMSANIKESTR